ncbi:MAG: hypothetical protein ACXWV1_04615 [Chitinophagaceae bacterium]
MNIFLSACLVFNGICVWAIVTAASIPGECRKTFAQTSKDKSIREAFITNFSDSGIIFQAGPILGRKFWQDAEQGTGLVTWKPVFGYAYGKTVVALVKE